MRHRQAVSLAELNEADINDSEDYQSKIKPSMLCSIPEDLIVPAFQPPLRGRPATIVSASTFSKSVHFDPHLKRVWQILQGERPLAVAAVSSPLVESDNGDMKLSFSDEDSNPSQPPSYKVDLSSDYKELIGTVAVANLAFEKTVVVRFTLDFWMTTSEVLAEYATDARQKQQDDGCDRFKFAIEIADLPSLDEKPMFFCIKYCVNGMEYWDSNSNYNFHVEFRKKLKPVNGQVVLLNDQQDAANCSRASTLDRSADGFMPQSRLSLSIPFSHNYSTTFMSVLLARRQTGRRYVERADQKR
ncbi:hypothetical protein O988_06871 [Pseudogymnoascus sp. VKM F-3808]|nr:hypothetical protein O988_06871 [Pseudogymnoascus sp. VKM F-3808]